MPAPATTSTATGRPTGYTAAQIVLHWVIAALIVVQLVLGEDMGPAWRAFRRGTEASADDLFNADIHVYVGLAVLALAAIRFGIRLVDGVPLLPAQENRWMKVLAHTVHGLLYLFMFGMPLSGVAAWYFGIAPAAEVHELAKPVIIGAVVLHAAGALYQHFVLRSDMLTRMIRPERRKTHGWAGHASR